MALSAPPESYLVFESVGFLVGVMKYPTEIDLMEQGFVLGLWIDTHSPSKQGRYSYRPGRLPAHTQVDRKLG